MLAAAVCIVALCGVALSAPQGVHFDFEKSVAVTSDGTGSGGQGGGNTHVVRIDKSAAHRQAAQDFFSSASGQALDQAGAQFFRALGRLAEGQRGQGQVSGGQVSGGKVSSGQARVAQVAEGHTGGGQVSGGQVSGGQTKRINEATPTQQSHRFVVDVKSPAHRQAAQDFYNSGSGQALDQAGARFFTSLGSFLSRLLGGGSHR